MKNQNSIQLPQFCPHDQHAIIFSSYSSMLEVMEEATARGTPLLRLSEDRAESAFKRKILPPALPAS